MLSPQPATRRRRWPIFVPFVLLVALAVIWTGLWFYAASAAESALAGWRAREAKSGRTYECGSQSISGFPFRIEVRCAKPVVEWRGKGPQLVLTGADVVMLAQIYQPTLLIGEFKGPMTVAEPGQPVAYVANWTLGQSSMRGTPRAPERGSLVFDDLTVQRSGSNATVFSARHLELHGRLAEGSVNSNPVIDLGLRARALAAPEVHPMAAVPLDAEVSATLRGLADFAPKPWSARFRELQARGGRIDYIVNGKLIGGFGVVAFPAEYGNSGIMTFIVNHDGIVYQRDLGDDTDATGRAMTQFDPGPGWIKVRSSNDVNEPDVARP